MKRLGVLLLVMLASGCASDIPERIRRAPAEDIGVARARANVDAFVGRQVRWGGTVVQTSNRQTDTLIEVIARPLTRSGRPEQTDRSEGRFMIRVPGFADPALFKEGRDITAAGSVEGSITRNIGDFPYRYPVLTGEALQLWEPLPEYEPYPYYVDPFWPYPGYPWRYPYHPYYYPYP